MDTHSDNLKKYCRLCKERIKTGPKYPYPKSCINLQEEITAVYGVTCLQEDENTFPKLLCSNCVKKLKRDVTNGTKRTVAEFNPHDDSCDICSQGKGRPTGKKNIQTHKSVLDEKFTSSGFTIFSIKEPRTYVKLNTVENHIVSKVTVHVKEDFSWFLVINGRNAQSPTSLPETLTDSNIGEFLNELDSFNICPGNQKFPDVVQNRLEIEQPFKASDGTVAATVETMKGTVFQKESFTVARHPDCELLFKSISKEMCQQCLSLDKKFFTYRKRQAQQDKSEKRVSDSSHTNLCHLNKEELIERCRNLQSAKKEALRTVATLTEKVNRAVTENGVYLDKNQHEVVKTVIENEKPQFEEGSAQWLLWEQQLKYASLKNHRSMRWHPLIIRFCLSIYHSSPAAYKQLASKKNSFIMLPHVNTLKKYINFTSPTTGFNADIIAKLIEDSNLKNLSDLQKNVVILFDEMKIKGDLVYSRTSGKIIGFTEMGDINEEISQIQEDTAPEDKKLARYVNVFMVRGIFTNLAYPFGYHASTGMTGDQLYPCCLEATSILECIDFKVRAWVCDGASPNRKFFKICENLEGNKEVGYWTFNPFDKSRKIYFFSDYPHLMKTTRNNLENSHGHLNTRNLHFDGQDISWNHVLKVYEWDLDKNGNDAFGLRLLPKMTEDHVSLSPRLRMKVKLAVQVLSSSVGNALQLAGKFYTAGTQTFIKNFDRLFDCLNGTRSSNYGKPDRAPYRKIDDPRFTFMEGVLDYLKRWRKEADGVQGLTKEEKARRCISKQTEVGWHITIKSFIDLTKTLLREGAMFVLSEKFSQDPIEEHFGRQRRAGGANENPNLYQFQRQETALNVMRSDLINDLRGNTSGTDRNKISKLDTSDMRKLPHRPRSVKKD